MMDTVDGPHDPLLTARSGGLDSVHDLEHVVERGFLGEVIVMSGRGVDAEHTVEELRGVKVVELASGFGTSVAIDQSGNVHPLCGGELDGKVDIPLEKIALGEGFGVGIGLQDKRLYSWGIGTDGQLGLGHTRGTKVIEAVRSVHTQEFKQVACGSHHAAAVTSDGFLYSWGLGDRGQLGQCVSHDVDLRKHSHMSVRMTPKLVQLLVKTRVCEVSCGAKFTAALDTQGFVWTWGEGMCGQLGTGRCSHRSLPRIAIGPCGAVRKPAVPKGDANLTAEDFADIIPEFAQKGNDENQTCERDEGQVVEKTKDFAQNQTRPITSLACGESHVICADMTGDVFGWGLNNFGQLGTGDTRSRTEPEKIKFKASKVSACHHTSAGVTAEGCFVWGLQIVGEQARAHFVPQRVAPGLSVNLASAAANGGLVVLVPTSAVSISPSNGPCEGGTEVRVVGVGLWQSEKIRVRFAPLKRKQQQQNNADEEIISGGHENNSNQGGDDDQAEDEVEDDIVDALDSASVGSGDSAEEGESSDPRKVVEVSGTFENGVVVCRAPEMAAPGVVLVQLALDGVTFTTENVFYLYSEPCKVSGVSKVMAFCSNDSQAQTASLDIQGEGFLAMPELTARLVANGKHYSCPAQLVSGSQITSSVNLVEALDHLTQGDAHVHAEVQVSLNGVDFSSSPSTFSIYRPEISGASCKSLPYGTASPAQLSLSCRGLPTGPVFVELCYTSEQGVQGVNVVAAEHKNGLVVVKVPPALELQWPIVPMLPVTFRISADRLVYAPLNEPVVFYSGALACEAIVPHVASSVFIQGLVFPEATPRVRIETEEGLLVSETIDVVPDAGMQGWLASSISLQGLELPVEGQLRLRCSVALNGVHFSPAGSLRVYEQPSIVNVSLSPLTVTLSAPATAVLEPEFLVVRVVQGEQTTDISACLKPLQGDAPVVEEKKGKGKSAAKHEPEQPLENPQTRLVICESQERTFEAPLSVMVALNEKHFTLPFTLD